MLAGRRTLWPRFVKGTRRSSILHGCEVDILPDGSLDFSDRLLQQFDIVLASLHERAGHGPDRLLRRYAMAMRHPLVTAHHAPDQPDGAASGRLPARLGSPDCWRGRNRHDSRSRRRAVPPRHGWRRSRDARSRRVHRICIDSDCHRADMLARQMELGVMTARRGWVEPRHVINTRSIADIRRLIAAKRSG